MTRSVLAVLLIFSSLLNADTADAGKKEAEKRESSHGSSEKSILEDISLSNTVLNISQNQEIKLNFGLEIPAKLSAYVWDAYGRRIRVLTENSQFLKGRHSLTWDGKDDTEQFVPNEAYTFSLHVEDESGGKDVYDPFNTGGEVVCPASTILSL